MLKSKKLMRFGCPSFSMMSQAVIVLVGALFAVASGCTTSVATQESSVVALEPVKNGLDSLLLTGSEIHASLKTDKVESLVDNVPTGMKLPANPYLSNDEEFVEATARGGSQGRLGGEGVRAALYARYSVEETDIGIYALEASTDADARLREEQVREIWAYNESLNRTKVFRSGRIILVLWIWGKDPLPDVWDSIQLQIQRRMKAVYSG